MCHVDKRVSSLEFGGTKVDKQYLLAASPVRSKSVFLEMSLLIEEISRYQGMVHMVFVS